jgi:hypothetical protein
MFELNNLRYLSNFNIFFNIQDAIRLVIVMNQLTVKYSRILYLLLVIFLILILIKFRKNLIMIRVIIKMKNAIVY